MPSSISHEIESNSKTCLSDCIKNLEDAPSIVNYNTMARYVWSNRKEAPLKGSAGKIEHCSESGQTNLKGACVFL